MTALLLFPGAGSSSTHASLVAIEQAVSPTRCVRADFAYRKAGRRAPDRAPVLLEAVRAEASVLAGERLILGGRSMGGRVCSLAVADADDPLPAAGLVLISYPLHPPGKPEKLRVEHLPRLHVPCLFVSGTKDTFGTRDELQHWTATIPGQVTHHWFEGKGHDLKGCDEQIATLVAAWVQALG
ncbi:MAG: dienelactone hydrolase [Actinomycetota bacterium]|nr:dienelactone hydrolase [Actinomycetota bacterium]